MWLLEQRGWAVEALANEVEQRFGAERLLEEALVLEQLGFEVVEIDVVPAGENHGEVGAVILEDAGELLAGEAAGHDEVGDEQCDGVLVFAPEPEGFHAGGGLEDTVAVGFEREAGDGT